MIPAPRASLAALALLLCGSFLHASEEDFLPWRSVRIECFENREAGKVSISARVGGKGIVAFTIEAFGKSYPVQDKYLLKIKAFPLESLRVTHEAGYQQLGGHTVHARLRRTTYDKEGKTVVEDAYVSVSKGKGLAVTTLVSQGGG